MSMIIAGKAHNFFSPNKVIFGMDTIRSIADEIKRLGGTKPIIVTDQGVVKADLIEPVKESLGAAGMGFAVYDQVQPEPPDRNINEAAAMFKSEGCDIVIGLGGGSSMDVAKGVSVVATNGGDILDWCGVDVVKKRGAPKILCPTTAGTGSEITRVLVLTDEKENTKKVVFSDFVLGETAIVDPMLTLSMPPKVTAESGIDALVHAIETYVSVNATPFSDMLAEPAIELIAEYLPIAWSKGSNVEARYQMSLAATVAGMAFGSGGLGAVHALSYPLGTEYHMPHGRANAVMLPHIMHYNISGNTRKFAAIAELMGSDVSDLDDLEAAHMAVAGVEDLLDTVNISYRLCDYDIPESDIPKLVEGGMLQSRLFVPNPRDLTEDDVREIYENAYE